MLSIPGSSTRQGERKQRVMRCGNTIIKPCKCGHGKSIHSGIFQRKRIGPAKFHYPEFPVAPYRAFSAHATKSKK